MKDLTIDPAQVPGWAVDADPENDPTYPIRDRSQQDAKRLMVWERPTLQEEKVEILRSIEHNRLPAVFGTTRPPRGLSGMIRRGAFTYSESHWLHWLMLMGADRIDVVEGLIEDLGRGKIPNIPAEMGARSEWKHNKKGLVSKVAVLGGIAAAVFLATKALSNSRDDEQSDAGQPGNDTSDSTKLEVNIRPASD